MEVEIGCRSVNTVEVVKSGSPGVIVKRDGGLHSLEMICLL